MPLLARPAAADGLLQTPGYLQQELNKFHDGNKRLYVLHQHKGGGSTLCKFFQRCGPTHVPPQSNCNGPFWIATRTARGRPFDIDALLRLEPGRKFNTFFNEIAMPYEEVPWDRFIFITTVRSPEERIVSNLFQQWGKMSTEKLTQSLREYIAEGGSRQNSDYVANYQTLNIAGVANASMWQMAEIYARAVQRLSHFVLTVPTDELGRRGLRTMQHVFECSAKDLERIHANGKNTKRYVEKLHQKSPALMKSIQQENAWDSCLYKVAQRMFEEQNRYIMR